MRTAYRGPGYTRQPSRGGSTAAADPHASLYGEAASRRPLAFSPPPQFYRGSPPLHAEPRLNDYDNFYFPIARASLSRSPVSERSPASGSASPQVRGGPLVMVNNDVERYDDGLSLRRRVARLEAENEALRDRLLAVSAAPNEVVTALQREIRDLVLAREAAEAALLELQADHLSLQQRVERAVVDRQRGPWGVARTPALSGPSPPAGMGPPLHRNPPPQAAVHAGSGSALPGRRSQTVERRGSPSPSPFYVNEVRSTASQSPPQPQQLERVRTPSRSLFRDDNELSPSPVIVCDNLSRPATAGRGAPMDRPWRPAPPHGAPAAPRLTDSGMTLQTIEELVRRSQRLRAAVDSRNSAENSAVSWQS